MKLHLSPLLTFFVRFALFTVLAVAVSGCNTASVEKTVLVPQTVVVRETVAVTQVQEKVITATPFPPTSTQPPPTQAESMPATLQSSENPSTASGEITATPEPLPQGFDAWCAKIDSEPAAQAWIAPQKAYHAVMVDGKPQLIFPNLSCTFVFTLEQPLAEGTQLWIYDRNPSPWLKKSLTAMPENPNQGYIVLKHSYITNPPFWMFDYRFEVRLPDGSVAWQHDVSFKNSKQPTWRCSTNNLGLGVFPNADTGKCPGEIELHPWDEGFGTPGPEWTEGF